VVVGRILGTIVLLTAIGCQITGAATIYVNESGWWVEITCNGVLDDGEQYNQSSTPISSAIGYADDGDEIIVKDGTYTEKVQVNKRLTLRSENGSANCIISSQNMTVTVSANYVSITGFSVNSSCYGYPTIWVQANYVNVTSCTVENYYSVSNGFVYGYGIIVNGSYCTIAGNLIRNCDKGVKVYSNYTEVASNEFSNTGSDIVLSGAWYCSVHNNEGNVELYDSHFNDVFDNNCSNHDYGIYMFSSSNNIIDNNTALFCEYGIYMSRSDFNEILSNNCSSSDYGVALIYSSWNTVHNNTCLNDTYAILLGYDQSLGEGFTSMNNEISENNCSLSTYGIYENYAGSNRIINNTVSDNQYGLYFAYSDSNDVSDNVIANNNCGAHLDNSSYNWITYNNFFGNSYGMNLTYSSYSYLFMNNFVDNTYNVYSQDSDNTWNTPWEVWYEYNSSLYQGYLGNYWGDYVGTDHDKDGIGDSPYEIDNDCDNYPLMDSSENYVILGLGGEVPPIPELPVVLLVIISAGVAALGLRKLKS